MAVWRGLMCSNPLPPFSRLSKGLRMSHEKGMNIRCAPFVGLCFLCSRPVSIVGGHICGTSSHIRLDRFLHADSSFCSYFVARGEKEAEVATSVVFWVKRGVALAYELCTISRASSIASASGLISIRQVGSSLMSSKPKLLVSSLEPLLPIDSRDVDSAKLLSSILCIASLPVRPVSGTSTIETRCGFPHFKCTAQFPISMSYPDHVCRLN